MDDNNIFYVYLHIRNDKKTVFYVGKGRDGRAYSKSSRNIYWKRIVKKHGYSIVIVATNMSECCAYTMEKILINQIGFENLCNMTHGGDGASFPGNTNPFFGKKHTLESRRKIVENRVSLTGKDHPLYDATTYKMHHAKYGLIISQKYTISKALNIPMMQLCRVLRGERHSCRGWVIYGNNPELIGSIRTRGSGNKTYDTTNYEFYHTSGLIYVGTKLEMSKKFNLDRSSITKIVNGKRSMYCGWAAKVLSARMAKKG